jgi:hypothetical protein
MKTKNGRYKGNTMECDLCRKFRSISAFYGDYWFKGVLCCECTVKVGEIRNTWAEECVKPSKFVSEWDY